MPTQNQDKPKKRPVTCTELLARVQELPHVPPGSRSFEHIEGSHGRLTSGVNLRRANQSTPPQTAGLFGITGEDADKP